MNWVLMDVEKGDVFCIWKIPRWTVRGFEVLNLSLWYVPRVSMVAKCEVLRWEKR